GWQLELAATGTASTQDLERRLSTRASDDVIGDDEPPEARRRKRATTRSAEREWHPSKRATLLRRGPQKINKYRRGPKSLLLVAPGSSADAPFFFGSGRCSSHAPNWRLRRMLRWQFGWQWERTALGGKQTFRYLNNLPIHLVRLDRPVTTNMQPTVQ